jgi:hypothetical protein
MAKTYIMLDTMDGEEPKRSYTSPKSPTNNCYARTHAELAGRKDPPLAAGVSFTEELDATPDLLFPYINKQEY